MAEIKFEINKTVGILSESAKGWTKELNLVSWNDKPAKYDIGSGIQLMRKWPKGLHCQLMN